MPDMKTLLFRYIIYIAPVAVAAGWHEAVVLWQKVSPRFQKLPNWVKRVIIATVAFGLTMVAQAGIPIDTTDPTQLNAASLGPAVSAILAYIFHISGRLSTATVTKDP